MERLGVEVSAAWPLDRPERRIQLNGVEEFQVLQWPKHLTFQDRPEIDSLLAAVVKSEGQRVRTDDVDLLDAVDGVTHSANTAFAS